MKTASNFPQGSESKTTRSDTPSTQEPDVPASEFQVVAIGASAGGLESLERFFVHLPPDTGMAFVVLQHLSPDFKSLMDELLARRTQMRICPAQHDMAVEPNTVYLLPPMKEMIIRRRRLLLNDKDPRHGLTLPIDLFFRSLAQDVGDRAVAVVLSGSGSDGSRGIQEVKRGGGVVFSESTDTAQFNGMPLSAIRTGIVDQILPPEEIALAIAGLNRPPKESRNGELSDEERSVDSILRLLREEYAIDFSHYKTSTVTRRIERRLALNHTDDLELYVEQLGREPEELSSLYEDLLIGVTRFFRDDAAFEALEQRIVPELVDRTSPDEQIRVWVPGCATGQEAYSIAILLHERLAARRRPVNLKLLASDVHKASLEAASAGVFTEEQMAGVSAERIDRFFTLRPGGYQISQALRETIVFAPHNLLRDAPFTRLDLISCRNLLIYLQPHAQKTVLTLFHFSLKPGGCLFLGSSESPGGLLDEFDTLDEHAKIYRKRRDLKLPRDVRLPVPRSTAAPLRPTAGAARATGVDHQLLGIYDRLLDRFMPPSFLVDEHGQLTDTFGGAEAYLKAKARRPSQNLMDLLDEYLRPVIAGALHRVRRDVESVKYPGIPVTGHARISVVAEPLRGPRGEITHILVSLVDPASQEATAAQPETESPARPAEGEPIAGAAAALSHDQVRALEDELVYTREHLQSAIQEHEAANEELQATNEELIASNEELQSTNEELHSVNEELYTVNAEYQKKNIELQEANDDVEHLLNGTDVATIFLDRLLCIRKFTPRIAEIFRVIGQDIGRPIRTFAHDLIYPTLIADIEQVLQKGGVIERQAWDRRHRCYFVRILPYRARQRAAAPAPAPAPPDGEQAPDGVVLTLTDISALEQARSRLAQLSAIVESSDDAIIGTTLDGVLTTWNRGAQRLYGFTPEEAVGRHASFLYPAGRKEEVDTTLEQVRSGTPVERLETTRLRKDGSIVHVAVTYSPILDAAGAIVGVSAISRDITALVRARLEIAEREERIRLLLDSTAEAIYGVDLSGICVFCNAACARVLGYDTPAALVGKQMHQLVHHTHADGRTYAAEDSTIYEAMRRREPTHVADDVLWRADGTSFPAEYWSHPIFRNGELIGAVVTFLDITERKRADAELQDGVRRREQFLAMLSHELRNPLAAILSATRIISGANLENAACHEAGQVVARQAHHMSRLLDDLLDVARITRGRIVLRKEHVDLRNAARSAIEALGPFMAERETSLTVDITDDPVIVNGDPARLQQIQANLLDNASKYSPRGGNVHLQLQREGEFAVIRVSDNGRGIDPEILPRIFDLFVQGRQSLSRPEGGLGIGLTLLRSLVEQHDGRVEAQSAGPGRGSTFSVWLPLVPAAETRDASAAPVARPVRTVVLVEDQADARRMMQLLLEAYGVTVLVAAHGGDGAALIERHRPDLALVDLGLPVLSGFELARRIRANADTAGTRLVALSGYGQDSDIQAAREAGFDEHLTKPPDLNRLEALLAGQT